MPAKLVGRAERWNELATSVDGGCLPVRGALALALELPLNKIATSTVASTAKCSTAIISKAAGASVLVLVIRKAASDDDRPHPTGTRGHRHDPSRRAAADARIVCDLAFAARI